MTWGCDVIAKNGNGCEEIAGRWQNDSLCPKQICLLGVICKDSNRKTLPGETFCFLEKCLLSIL